jgi:uncharacterized protein (TIGR02453 family)
MAHFSKDFSKFFKELKANNNREWFDANKSRYEQQVKKPFEVFITDLLAAMYKFDKQFDMEGKECIFRIYRDVRFSKDKQPYKLHMSAALVVGGRKALGAPGFYLELTGEGVGFYCGIYQPETKQLLAVREKIAEEPERFAKLIKSKAFVQHFKALEGEKGKVIPKELKEAAAAQPLIYNKQFLMIKHLPTSAVTSDTLVQDIMDAFKASRDMHEFLLEATDE